MKHKVKPTPALRLIVCDTCRQTIEGTLALSKRLCFCGEECAHEWSAKVLEAASSLQEGNLIVAAIGYVEAIYSGNGGALAFTVLEAAARQVSLRLRQQSAALTQNARDERIRQQAVDAARLVSAAIRVTEVVEAKPKQKQRAELAFAPSEHVNKNGVGDE